MSMRKAAPLLCLLLAIACGGDSVTKRDQKDYDVVEEGAANGVTSTISGPGEVLPPATNTNADTTTAFTLDPTATGGVPATPAPMTSAYPSATPNYMPPTAPRAQPQPAQATRRDPEPAPPATDTSVAPATDTATATATTEKPKDETPPEQEPQQNTDTEEPQPPPTQTDTRGQ